MLPLVCLAGAVEILLAFHPQPAVAASETIETLEMPDIPNTPPQVVERPAPLPAEFNAHDFASTVRWIANLCSRVEEARHSQNEGLHLTEWNAVSRQLASVSGTPVQWQIPAGGLRQGFLNFARPTAPIRPFGECTVYVSTFGKQFDWPPAELRRRPFPGNSAERQRLPFRGEAQVNVAAGEVPGLETSLVGDTLSIRAGKPVLVSGKASLSLSVTDREIDVVITEAMIDASPKSSLPPTSSGENATEVLRQLDQSQDDLLRELQQGFDRTRRR